MKRPLLFVGAAVLLLLFSVRLLVNTPGSISEALLHPFHALFGTGHNMNVRLIEVSEAPDSIRAASERLLQPWGAVRMVRYHDLSAESEKKTDLHTR